MKFLLFLTFCVLMVCLIQAEIEKCFDGSEECHSTNYQSYVDCVRRRHKRSLDCNSSCNSGNCIDTCGDCDCSSCNYSKCENSCNSCCSSCCSNYVPCRTNHCCHKTCQAQCKSTSCRSVCRKNCFDTVTTGETASSNTSSVTINENRPNVTTIIHLNNVINNTNIIDVPISLNYTTQNNISLNTALANTGSAINSTDKDCCIVISPRKCVPQKEFPFVRCFHYRSRQCGEYCTASIIHKEERQVCQSVYPGATPNCYQQEIYIPQPQPRCSYQSTWPYVSCGIQRSTSCNGCYNHYVNQNSKAYLTCPTGCYDDGFGAGPFYRQGPVYRPTYLHAPCDIGVYGGCGGAGGFGGYGSFGSYGGFGGYGGYGGFGGPGGFGGFGGYGGYGGLGGFGVPNFGYGGYPGGAIPSFGYPQMPFGSWSPGNVSNFGYGNESAFNSSDGYIPIDPLISVGPGISNPSAFVDPFRAAREIEIEVDYEPPSSAEAEVKIKQQNITKETEDASEEPDKSSTVSFLTKKS